MSGEGKLTGVAPALPAFAEVRVTARHLGETGVPHASLPILIAPDGAGPTAAVSAIVQTPPMIGTVTRRQAPPAIRIVSKT